MCSRFKRVKGNVPKGNESSKTVLFGLVTTKAKNDRKTEQNKGFSRRKFLIVGV